MAYIEVNQNRHLQLLLNIYEAAPDGEHYTIDGIDCYLTNEPDKAYQFIIYDCGVMQTPIAGQPCRERSTKRLRLSLTLLRSGMERTLGSAWNCGFWLPSRANRSGRSTGNILPISLIILAPTCGKNPWAAHKGPRPTTFPLL